MALVLNDKSTGKRSEAEAQDLIAGCDDSMIVLAGETLDGVAQGLNIVCFVVNLKGTVTNLIANDGQDTDVAAGGLVKGYKNIAATDLEVGTFIQAGKYFKSRTWNSLTTGTAEVIAYYNYLPSTRNTP